jgi:hypothetical protein
MFKEGWKLHREGRKTCSIDIIHTGIELNMILINIIFLIIFLLSKISSIESADSFANNTKQMDAGSLRTQVT